MFQGERWECPSSVSSKTWHGLPLSSTPTNAITSSDAKGGVALARKLGLRLLGQIPLVCSIAESGDAGEPIAARDTVAGMAFVHAARELTEAVAERHDTLPPTTRVELKH